jgi:type IV pilus biogenesis protein CpaD/CtpE
MVAWGAQLSCAIMRLIVAFTVLAACLCVGGCSRASQTAHAKPAKSSPPHPTTVKKSSKPTQVTAVKSQSDADAKWKAAQEKATVNGVETLNQKDIEGLSLEQIKQLRGY